MKQKCLMQVLVGLPSRVRELRPKGSSHIRLMIHSEVSGQVFAISGSIYGVGDL